MSVYIIGWLILTWLKIEVKIFLKNSLETTHYALKRVYCPSINHLNEKYCMEYIPHILSFKLITNLMFYQILKLPLWLTLAWNCQTPLSLQNFHLWPHNKILFFPINEVILLYINIYIYICFFLPYPFKSSFNVYTRKIPQFYKRHVLLSL